MSVGRKTDSEQLERKIRHNINFDGSKFWLEGKVVGEVVSSLKFRNPISKAVMDVHREMILGRVMEGEV